VKRIIIPITVLFIFSLAACGPKREEAKAYNDLLQSIEIALNRKVEALDKTYGTFKPELIEPALYKAQKKVKQATEKIKRVKPFYGNDKLRQGLETYIGKVDTILHEEYVEMLNIYKRANYTPEDEKVFDSIKGSSLSKLKLADDLLMESQKVFIVKYNLNPEREEAKNYNFLIQSLELALNTKIDVLEGSFQAKDIDLMESSLLDAQEKVQKSAKKIIGAKPFYNNDNLRKGLETYISTMDVVLHEDYETMLNIYKQDNLSSADEAEYNKLKGEAEFKLKRAKKVFKDSEDAFINKYNLIQEEE